MAYPYGNAGVPFGTQAGFQGTALNATTKDLDAFIPELWSDEIIAAYKLNLVLAPLVNTMNHVGKKGDTIHIPKPYRGVASKKVEGTEVNVIANDEGSDSFVIDQHWEYSRLIEDFAAIQAIDSYRQFYTDDGGYSLATNVDTALHKAAEQLNGASFYNGGALGGAYDKADITSTDSTYGTYVQAGGTGDAEAYDGTNAAALTDYGIRRYNQFLDDNDVPSVRRCWVIPPVEKRKLMASSVNTAGGTDAANGLPYVSYNDIGEAGGSSTYRTGLIGDLYGSGIYVSSNCGTSASADGGRASLFFQKDAMVYLEQMTARSQEQYKQEFLSTLFTSDIIYGTGVLRPEAGVVVLTEAS